MIPDEARTLLSNMRESMGQTGFLDAIWSSRDYPHRDAKPVGKWPFIRVCDRVPEAVVDVARLPVRLRNHGNG